MEILKKEILKVEPKEGENENDFMGRCVPAMMDEGKEQDQAVAMCMSMFNKNKEQKEAEKKEKDWQGFDNTVKGCGDKKPKK